MKSVRAWLGLGQGASQRLGKVETAGLLFDVVG
jgi:hypothetical protein